MRRLTFVCDTCGEESARELHGYARPELPDGWLHCDCGADACATCTVVGCQTVGCLNAECCYKCLAGLPRCVACDARVCDANDDCAELCMACEGIVCTACAVDRHACARSAKRRTRAPPAKRSTKRAKPSKAQ